MGKYTDKLIEIYSKCNIDQLREDQDFHKLCSENENHREFNTERNQVEQIKKMLEKTAGQQSSTKNQVIEALRILNRTIDPENEEAVNICYDLIIKTYSRSWTLDQLAHFNKYCDALKKYYDFFLSFTDRNPTPNQDNILNT